MMVNKEGRSAIYRAQGPEIFERRKAVGMLLQSANVSVSSYILHPSDPNEWLSRTERRLLPSLLLARTGTYYPNSRTLNIINAIDWSIVSKFPEFFCALHWCPQDPSNRTDVEAVSWSTIWTPLYADSCMCCRLHYLKTYSWYRFHLNSCKEIA